MPREQITFPAGNTVLVNENGIEWEHEPGAPVPEGCVLVTEPALHVSWTGADNEYGTPHVQVSFQLDARYLVARAKGLEGVTSTHIYTDSLSRVEINKLIKVLRTARDKAYGRDE